MGSLEKPSLEKEFLAVLVVLLTLIFFNSPGSSDVYRFWLPWIGTYKDYGFVAGFASIGGDYPPLGMFFLYMVERFADWLNVAPTQPLRFSITLFLFLTSATYFYICRNIYTTVLMHVMLLLSSTVLLYLDVYYAPFLLLAFWSLKNDKPLQAMLLYIVACSIKYQPLILFPIFFTAIYKHYQQENPQQALKQTAQTILIPGICAALFMLLIFGEALFDSIVIALTHSKYSFQAMNIYWIYVNIASSLQDLPIKKVNNPESMLYISRATFAIIYCLILKSYLQHGKTFKDTLLFCIAGFYSYFILITGVHENHLTVAAVVASLLYIVSGQHRASCLFIMIMSNLNMLIFYGLNGKGLGYDFTLHSHLRFDTTMLIALLNCAFYLYLLWFVLFAIKNNRETINP